jgi:hypothetical protein
MSRCWHHVGVARRAGAWRHKRIGYAACAAATLASSDGGPTQLIRDQGRSAPLSAFDRS